MKKITIIAGALLSLLVGVSSCNDEWTEEQFVHYIGFRAPLDATTGVTPLYVQYTRTDTTGKATYGEGQSDYKLPLIVSGSTTNDKDFTVHVANDPDTLKDLNYARYQNRTDLHYVDMQQYATFPEKVDFTKGSDVSLLNIKFNFNNIDMSEKWVLPIRITPGAGYTPNTRKNYDNALLRIFPFNDFSGVYNGTTLLNYVKGDEGNGAIVANTVTAYVVNDNTVFFYAGINDEDRTDRRNYKIFMQFEGETSGTIKMWSDNPKINFVSNKEASFRVSETMDEVRPYLMHRYVTINNIDYEYTDYTSSSELSTTFTVRGSITMERKINTQIPDEQQAIEW